MGRFLRVNYGYSAYWNSSKMCWEIMIQEAAGDRYISVLKHANLASRMLADQKVKFIDARNNLYNKTHLVLIVDYTWFDNFEDEIIKWCEESNIRYKRIGMILEFENLEDKIMFTLRWS